MNETAVSLGIFSSPEKRSVVLCLLLVVVTLALYNPVSSHPFVNYDDDRYITDNLHVRSGLNWDSISWAFTSFDEANWHPLTWISHEVDCQIYKLNPAGHHYTNLLFHAANVALLFLVLQWATGLTWPSLLVALLFAVHPVNVETVAWVAERKNVLSMMFFLLALAAYTRYARRPNAGQYLLVASLFALGLMSKPMVITFPFVLLLWDFWPLQRCGACGAGDRFARDSPQGLFVEKMPLMLLAAASAVVTMKAQAAGGAVRSVREFPLAERLGNALVAYARYVLNFVWPVKLAPMYPHPENALPAWQVAVSMLLLIGITVCVIAARRRRYLVVGWLWFLGTLVPMIGLVQVGAQAMADRYAYLSYVGLFVMVVWGIAEWANLQRARERVAIGAACAVVLVLAVLTYRQLGYWADNVTLWTRTLEVTSDNFVAEDNLGGALLAQGRVEDAIIHFRGAARINPNDPVGNLNVAAYEQQHGQMQTSLKLYQRVLRMTPDTRLRATAYSNLGSAYRRLREYDQAKTSYEEAVRLVPNTPHAWIGLGLIAQKRGDFASAADDYSRAMSMQPTDVGYLLLAQSLEKLGRPAEAKSALDEAAKLSADLTQAEKGAANLLRE